VPPWSPCTPDSGGGVAACMQARETERARGGPRACMGPCGLWSKMGAGRESWVR
jgi:hypothetical protein